MSWYQSHAKCRLLHRPQARPYCNQAHTQPAVRKRFPQTKKLHVQQLLAKGDVFKKELEATLNNEELLGQESDPDKQWQHLKSFIQETVVEVAGFSNRKNRDWFDENDAEIQNLLQKKRSYHDRPLASNDDQAAKAAYRAACSTLQTKLREIQNKWWLELAERTQLVQATTCSESLGA